MPVNDINPIVVIPVYKEIQQWNQNEAISLKQCFDILSDHTICLIGPKCLNWEVIQTFIYGEFGKRVQIASFDNIYFADIAGYNKLLKSLLFYEHFSTYSHLLLYQLDAFVFKDELLEWCSKGFDYIGAPWMEGYTSNTSIKFVGVGNGGFSLHNIKSAINILKKRNTVLPILEACESTLLYQKLPQLKWVTRYILLKLIFKIKNQKYILGLSVHDNIYEDKFWGRYIPTTFTNFKVASIEEAIKFSFEVNPRYLYQLNMEQLPFGCHAWEKYDPVFWSQFIKVRTESNQ